MTHTWEEYQKAKEVVKIFLKEKRKISEKRKEQAGLLYLQPLPVKIWMKRIELEEEQYRISKLSKEKKDKLDHVFLNLYFNSLKNDILRMRKQQAIFSK